MAQAADRHLHLLRIAIDAHEGVLFKTMGDAVQAAFPSAPVAVAAALKAALPNLSMGATSEFVAGDWGLMTRDEGAFHVLRIRGSASAAPRLARRTRVRQ
jgi:hypothetical protein